MAVSKNQSSRWQQLADSSDKSFEKALNKAGAKGVPTTSGVMRNLGVTIDQDEPQSDPKAAKALWIWGRVNQFAENINEITPKQCIDRCDSIMKDDLIINLNKVINWMTELEERTK